MNYYNPYELYHHGIKGQKWGVRRYQNIDGTYTNAGKRRRNDDTRDLGPSRSSSGIGKKVATGLAIGAAASLTAYALANPKSRAYLKKLAGTSVSKLKAAANNPKVKEIVANNGKKALSFVGERVKEGGKAFTDAAIAATGAIAVSKVATKINTGNTEADQILTDATSAAISAMTKSTTSSNNQNGGKNVGKEVTNAIGSPSNKGIDKQSSAYQNLFNNADGSKRDDNTRSTIKALASKGYDIDQITEYLKKLDSGQLRHGVFMNYYYYNPYELYHHGIKGQKWGVRRFQNADGSLTAKGAKRYGVSSEGEVYKKSRRTRQLEKQNEFAKKAVESYDPIRGVGVKTKRGKTILTADDVETLRNAEVKDQQKIQNRMEKSSNRDLAKVQAKAAAKDIKEDYSRGSKIATNLLLGPFANTGISRLQAAGLSRGKAILAEAFLGPLLAIPAASIMAGDRADKDWDEKHKG